MPIEKPNITRIRKVGATYVVIPSIAIDHIRSADGLAILIYLLDKPENWTIRRADVMARFALSKARYAKAMRELHAKGFAWWHNGAGKDGKLQGRILCICAEPNKHLDNTEEIHRQAGIPDGREKPTLGESRHLHSDISTTTYRNMDEKDEAPPKPRKPGPRKVPDDWEPKEATIERFIALGMSLNDPQANLAEFIDYWRNSGKRKADWDATYFNHLKRSFTFETNQRKATNGHQATNSTQLLADNLNQALASDVEAGW